MRVLTGGFQFDSGALREGVGSHIGEHLVGRAEMGTRIATAALAPQPFPVHQVSSGEVGDGSCGVEDGNRLLMELLRVSFLGQQGTGVCQEA
jgi:hypothetical protein